MILETSELFKLIQARQSQTNENVMVLYIICALLAKKQNKNKILELLRMIARAVLIHGLIG